MSGPLTEAQEAKLVIAVLEKVVRIKLVRVGEAQLLPGLDVDDHPLGNGEVGVGDLVIFTADSLEGYKRIRGYKLNISIHNRYILYLS